MKLLEPDKTASLLTRVREQLPSPGIHRAIESCFTGPNLAEIQHLLCQQPIGGIAALCDPFNQPIEIIEHHPLLGLRSLTNVMKIQASSQAVEVLHRALTRPTHLRYDPIVVLNERGEFNGVIHLDRLIREVIGS